MWECLMTFTSKLNKLWKSSCSLVLPASPLFSIPASSGPQVGVYALHSDRNGTACIFKSWSLLPRISSYCFHLFQNANSISPKGPQTNVSHPFRAMELPKQIAAAREVCLCKSHLDQECASFQKALKQEMDLNLTEMKTKLKLDRIVYLEDEQTNVTQDTSRD